MRQVMGIGQYARARGRAIESSWGGKSVSDR
jgi:hypothetical protein